LNTENLPAIQHRELSPMELIGALLERKDVTTESVSAIERLADLHLKMSAKSAEVSFNKAYIALRRECKPIAATKIIPDREGNVRSRYATLEEIMKQVTPLLDKYGFCDMYSQCHGENGRTTVTATLIHNDGHERSAEFTCRAQESPGNTGAQNDSGTTKLAQRKALCLLLGIQFDYNADARDLGDTITPEDAADLERRVKAACGNEPAKVARYLKLADAPSFKEIKSAKYAVVIEQLERDERAKSTPASTGVPPTPEKVFRAALASWSGMTGDDFAQAAREVAKANGIDIKTANAVQFSNLTAFVSEQVANEVDFLAWRSSKK